MVPIPGAPPNGFVRVSIPPPQKPPVFFIKNTGIRPLTQPGFTQNNFFGVYYYALWQGASVAIPMGLVALLLPKKTVAGSKIPAKPPYRGGIRTSNRLLEKSLASTGL